MNKNKKLIIITGVSWSWKTTIQTKLINDLWFIKPTNFTTRKKRYDIELDEYVFINKNIFLKKLWNWDFLEITTFNWNLYWISKYIFRGDENNAVVVLDPIGRSQAIEYIKRNNLPIDIYTFYIEIWNKEQVDRLEKRWDSVIDIEKRKRDFDIFYPTPKCTILDWTKETWLIVKNILRTIGYE